MSFAAATYLTFRRSPKAQNRFGFLGTAILALGVAKNFLQKKLALSRIKHRRPVICSQVFRTKMGIPGSEYEFLQ
jgi:hypothetical protein